MIDQSLQELQQRVSQLDDKSVLKQSILKLIADIKCLNENCLAQEKKSSFIFHDLFAQKIMGYYTVLPITLKEILDKTVQLLDKKITVEDYQQFASTLAGKPSKEMKDIGNILMAIGAIAGIAALLTSAPVGIALLAAISISIFVLGAVLHAKSGPSSVYKETRDVASAFALS